MKTGLTLFQYPEENKTANHLSVFQKALQHIMSCYVNHFRMARRSKRDNVRTYFVAYVTYFVKYLLEALGLIFQ